MEKGSRGQGFRHGLSMLVKEGNQFHCALKDLISTFMHADCPPRQIFEELTRFISSNQSAELLIDTVSVMLDFEFGEDSRYQKVLQDLVECATKSSKSVEQIETLLRMTERVLIQDNGAGEFVLHESVKRLEQLKRPEREVEAAVASRLLTAFVSYSRTHLTAAFTFTVASSAEIFSALLFGAEIVSLSALGLLRALLKHQLIAVDDETLEGLLTRGQRDELNDGHIAFACELLAAESRDLPPWLVALLDKPQLHPAVSRSVLHCIASGCQPADPVDTRRRVLNFVNALDAPLVTPMMIDLVAKGAKAVPVVATETACQCVKLLGKEISQAVADAIVKAIQDIAPLVSEADLVTEISALLLQIGKKQLPYLSSAIRVLLSIDVQLIELQMEKILTWAKTALKVPRTRRYDSVLSAIKVCGALSRCTQNPLIFGLAHEVCQLLDEIDAAEVRVECVATCVALCAAHVVATEAADSNRLNSAVLAILGKLLDTAVADPSPAVRAAIFRELHSHALDGHLVLSDPLECIFMAINDSEIQVGLIALEICCRIAPRNPSIIVSGLGRVESRLVRDLQGASHTTSDEAIQKLYVMAAADQLTSSHFTIETICADKLIQKSSSFSFQRNIFGFLSISIERARVTDRHIEADVLIRRALAAIRTPNCGPRRRAAANALASVVRYVNRETDPEVFRQVVDAMQSSSDDSELINELSQVVGVMGGVDPSRSKVWQVGSPENQSTGFERSELESLRPPSRTHPRLQFQNASVALFTLAKCMATSNTYQQRQLVTCMGNLIDVVGPQQRLQLVPHLVPCLLNWLEDSNKSSHHPYFLSQLKLLWEQREGFLKPLRQKMMDVFERFSRIVVNNRLATENFVLLLVSMIRGAQDDVRNQQWIVAFMFQRIIEDRESSLAISCIEALEAAAFMLDRDIHLALVHVLACCESCSTAVQLRSISFFYAVVHSQAAKDCCSRLVLCMVSLIDRSANIQVQNRAVEFACALFYAVGKTSYRFVKLVDKVVERKSLSNETFIKCRQEYQSTGSFPEPEERRDPAASSAPSDLETLFVISSRAELTEQLVKHVLGDALSVSQQNITIISHHTVGGKSTVKLRFEGSTAADAVQHFITLVNHDDVLLRRLDIANLTTERIVAETTAGRDFGRALAKLRLWRKFIHSSSAQDWMSWIAGVALELVHCSEPALRTLSDVVRGNEMVAREIFPFAFVWVFSKLDGDRKREVMATLSSAIERCSAEVRQLLFGLAEFMESEKSEQVTSMPVLHDVVCRVQRASLDEKFGIHYEREGLNIVVVKVAEGGPGARAKVPVGFTLKRIGECEINEVTEIVAHIKDKLETVLHLVKEDHRRIVSSKHRHFFDLDKLAVVAYNSHLYSKAVHYYEMLYEENLDLHQMEPEQRQVVSRAATALINLYNVTGHTHEFAGLQAHVKPYLGEHNDIMLPVGPGGLTNNGGASLGNAVRQIEAQGRFEELAGWYDESLHRDACIIPPEIAQSGANAALALSNWDLLSSITPFMKQGPERNFMEGVLSVARGDPPADTKRYLSMCRVALSQKFASEIKESYSTAYDSLIQLQHLSHLKEVVLYRQASESVRARLHEQWKRRLSSMARNAQNWTVSLAISSIVVNPVDDLDCRLTYASICREVNWKRMAERTLAQLLAVPTLRTSEKLYSEVTNPRVALALFKEKYHQGHQAEAIREFEDYMTVAKDRHADDSSWGRCHLLLGEWLMNRGDAEKALAHVTKATEVDSSNIAGWHAWGMLAYRRALDCKLADPETATALIVSCIEGLFRAVELGEERLGTQDILRVMSIWFDFGHRPEILKAIVHGTERCPITAWLRVVPQLIARLGTAHREVRNSLTCLLQKIAEHFPHALIYPLTVSEKSGRDKLRRLAAGRVLALIREAQPALVDQASLISDELVRIAILWAEKWTETLTRASRMAERHDCKAVLETLSVLFDELETPTTGDEKLFESNYGQTLRRAKSALQTDVNAAQAWNFFQQVYQKINRPNRQLLLHSVSPRLSELKNSVVPVPGLIATTHDQTVTISQFLNEVMVIPSKHKPRRFGLRGSDGVEYRFLLKGHEDLRQDERVMQLFELINTLFRTDPVSNSLNLHVVRYASVPLSDNVGILSWIDDSETLFKLIEARRQANSVPMHEECNLIVKKGRLARIEDYQLLPKTTRKDLLQYAVDSTPSDELRRIFWDANDTCEEWLSHRTVYGRTLAVMSMVGYVLGLGDRHLNNLMIQKNGAIVHIDYGDCFETAMHREQFPERVPFRLTRLLVRALGVMEAEGTFRLTSELVVKALRKFRDSVLSVLETFVDDPLVSWKGRQGRSSNAKGQSTDQDDRFWHQLKDALRTHDVQASLQNSPNQSMPLAKPHEIVMADVRSIVTRLAQNGGIDAAMSAVTQFLPAMLHDVRVSGEAGTLAATEQFMEFFAQAQDENHKEFEDKALTRIRSKLTGTDFATASDTLLGSRVGPSSKKSPLSVDQSVVELEVDPSWWIRDSIFGESVAAAVENVKSTSPLDGEEMEERPKHALSIVDQVSRLIAEARSMDNLADAYLTGWAPFL